MKKRSARQVAAEKRYDLKRKHQPRLPAARLNEEENHLATQVFQLFNGSKKEALLEGLRLLFISMTGAKPKK
ncbi:MAG: hypothetical protein M8364_14590 [Methylobacter sp.]|uniref:hypothetical protein n=1 Tax=Methylobacter TaxID=429 RepID=UPI00037D913F|nr:MULTISPECIES: hypothetical protein [Methylobacter]MCL7422124.1 hypothetical protein [Methylobacter sp.]